MKWTKQKKIISVIILSCLSCIFLILPILMPQETAKQNNNLQKVEMTVSLIEQENEGALLVQKKEIEKKFINMVYERLDGTRISYFIDAENGSKIELNDLIKEEQFPQFEEKIKELLYKKYPKFIADILASNQGEIAYEIRDTELIIYYSNFTITPAPTEELTLTVDYHEIKDYLNFKVQLKDEKVVESDNNLKNERKYIAFTFDDGPSGAKTKKLVDILEDNKMHATFFMVGNRMALQPETLKYVLEHGNEIGSHSYTHSNLKRLKKEELKQEEFNTNLVYKNITGEELTLLRPPYGNINENMKETMNYIFVNWNIDTEDWRYRDSEHIYHSIIDKVEDGDIILMHDLYDTTIEAVEKVLPELYVRGFQVVSVSELAKIKGQTLEPKKVYRSIK